MTPWPLVVMVAFVLGLMLGQPVMTHLLLRGQRIVAEGRRLIERLEAENVTLREENAMLRHFVTKADAELQSTITMMQAMLPKP
jgi:hypothetical protein